jgi:hypothetical protein
VVRTPDGNRPTEEQEEQLLQDISRTNGWTGAQGSARTRSPTTLREKIDADELGRVALIQAGQLLGTSAPRGSLYIEAWRILTSDERLQLLDEHQAKRRSA